MTHRALSVFFVFSAPLALAACISSHEPTVESLEVDASIASVTLSDDCAAEAAPGLWAGDCAEDGPCGFCRQTSVSLTLDASAEGTSVPFEVVSIRLLRMDGELADELDPRAAQLFVDGAYVAWGEQIAPGDSLHVTYDTSAPDWTAIGGGNAWETHGMEFQVEMVVRIDGVARTLTFSPATRESEIVT